MKKMMVVLVMLAISGVTHAAYTYTYGPGTYSGSKSLNGTESILVNGGGVGRLTLFDYSVGRIESTSTLGQYTGGMWEFQTAGFSRAEVTGGEFHVIYVSSDSKLTISGGSVYGMVGMLSDLPAIPENKHIQFICKSYQYNPTNQCLSGVWGNDAPFSILLATSPGYVNVLQSINFTIVPEPMTLGLLAFGGLLIRRYRHS